MAAEQHGHPRGERQDDGHPPELPPAAGLTDGGPYRYARWDGRQRLPSLSPDELLEQLADDLLTEGELSSALGRLLSRGLRRHQGSAGEGLPGLRELRARLARAREELLSRYELNDVLSDVREALDEVVATEQRGIERRLAGAAARDERTPEPDNESLQQMAVELTARRQSELQSLPPDVGGRIRALQDYDFLEPAAREHFEELMEGLRRQVLDSYFTGLSEAIKGLTPEQLAQNREMVRELNGLLQERLAGREPDVSGFLARHGQFFPGARTMDDIIEQLAERMAAMQSLLSSLGLEQRRELQSMMDALLRDDRLRWDLAQLAATLEQLLPDGVAERFDFRGVESLSLEAALQQLAHLTRIEQMSDKLAGVAAPAALEEIDADELEELLGRESGDDLRALQALARQLEEAGYAERRGGRLQLTPRGARRVGQRVLDDLFGRLQRDLLGGHQRPAAGVGGERSGSSRAYEFGRPFDLDLQRTLANALARTAQPQPRRAARRAVAAVSGTGRWGEARSLDLSPDDFEIHESETATRAATVLLVDMSRSMLLRGCFLAAKKVAIALDMLIRTRFPRDELHVVGFAYYAREIRSAALAELSWQGYEYGTNLQHGLMLARERLARSHAANRGVVVITDGEPTAHFEQGQVEFSYPPTRRTIEETLREVGRCTREGITINTFMLERSRALTEFVERMTRLNRGRAFYAAPERLGEYVLVDYVDRRSRAS